MNLISMGNSVSLNERLPAVVVPKTALSTVAWGLLETQVSYGEHLGIYTRDAWIN